MLQKHARKGMIAAALGFCLAGVFLLVPGLVTFALTLVPQKPPQDLAAKPIPQPAPANDSAAEASPENGRFGIAKEVFASSKLLERPAEAKALAGAFSQTAEKVRSEEPGVWRIMIWINSASGDAIPESSEVAWAELKAKLSAKLTSMYGSGRLASAGDWADCFEEVARGLEAAGSCPTL